MSDDPTFLSPEDAACLRMLAGAHFGPGATLTLPSGRVLEPDEMQALSSAYAEQPPFTKEAA